MTDALVVPGLGLFWALARTVLIFMNPERRESLPILSKGGHVSYRRWERGSLQRAGSVGESKPCPKKSGPQFGR